MEHWRKRFHTHGLAGLYGEQRPGRPRTHDDERVAGLVNMKQEREHAEGESLEFKFTVSIGSVHVPHTQVVTRHVFGDVALFCMSQVADEDRHLVQAGFDMVRSSLGMTNTGSTGH
jgi:hypothetical protein